MVDKQVTPEQTGLLLSCIPYIPALVHRCTAGWVIINRRPFVLGCRYVRLQNVCVLLNRIDIPSQRAHLHSCIADMRMYMSMH